MLFRSLEKAMENLDDYGLFCVRALHTDSEYHRALEHIWDKHPTEPNSYTKKGDFRHFFTVDELRGKLSGFQHPVQEVSHTVNDYFPIHYDVQRYLKSVLMIVQKLPSDTTPGEPGVRHDFGIPRLPFLKYLDQIPTGRHRALLLGHSDNVQQALEERTDYDFDIETADFVDRLPKDRYGFIGLTLDPSHKDWERYRQSLASGQLQTVLNGAIEPGGYVSINFARNAMVDPRVTPQD